MLIPLRLYYFNSIKVQLKQVVNLICIDNSLFQFHKGTIKTVSYLALKKLTLISIP